MTDFEKRVIRALERIADALAPSSEPPTCQHPAEARVDMSTMGHTRWICVEAKGGCGFKFEGE